MTVLQEPVQVKKQLPIAGCPSEQPRGSEARARYSGPGLSDGVNRLCEGSSSVAGLQPSPAVRSVSLSVKQRESDPL